MNIELGQIIGALMSGIALFGIARIANKIDKIEEKFEDCIRRREYDEDCAKQEEAARELERWKHDYVGPRFHRIADIVHALYTKVWPDRDPPNLRGPK